MPEEKKKSLKDTLVDKGWDTVETIGNTLGLLQSIAAHYTTEAFTGKQPEKPIWGYDWTDAYADITGKKEKQLNKWERGLLLGANIIADPANFLPGAGAAKQAGKIRKGLNLAENAKTLKQGIDFIDQSKDVLLKAAKKEKELLTEAMKTVANSKQKKQIKDSLNSITEAEKFLNKSSKNTIREILQETYTSKFSRLNPLKTKNISVLDQYRPARDLEFYRKTGGNAHDFNKYIYQDDIKLKPQAGTLKEKGKSLQETLKGTEETLKEAQELVKNTPEKTKKIYDTVLKRNKNLNTKTLERLEKLTGKKQNDIIKEFSDYQKAYLKIKNIPLTKAETSEALKGIPKILEAETLLDLKRTSEGLKQITLKEQKSDISELMKIAKRNKLDYSELNKQIIKYIETGDSGKLGKEAIDYAENIVKPFLQRNYMQKKIINPSLARVENYVPRRLKKNAASGSLKIGNKGEELLNLPFSYQEKPQFIIKDYKGTDKSRAIRDLTSEELQAYNKAFKGRAELIEDIPTLMKKLKEETIDSYVNKSARVGAGSYSVDNTKERLRDFYNTYIADVGVQPVNARRYQDKQVFNETRKLLKKQGVPDALINSLRKNATTPAKFGAILERIRTNDKYAKYFEPINKLGYYKRTGIKNIMQSIPKQVYDRLQRFINTNEKSPNQILDFVKNWTGIWKAMSLGVIPSYHVNNIIDNVGILLWDQPAAFKNFSKAAALQKGKSLVLDTAKGRKTLSYPDIARTGILGGKYGIGENQRFLESLETMPGNILEQGANTFKNIISQGFDIGNFLEDKFRIAVFIDEIENGKNVKQATDRIFNIFYDPSNINEKTAIARDYFFPFVNFTVQNVGKALRRIYEKPQYIKYLSNITETSKLDVKDDPIKDKFTDNSRVIKIGSNYWDLTPKIAALDPFNYLDDVISEIQHWNQDSPRELFNIPYQMLAPYKSVFESVLNFNPRTGKPIDYGKGANKYLFAIPITQRADHILKANIRLYKILSQAVKDPDNPHIQSTFIEKLDNIKSNTPMILLGTAYNKNIKRIAFNEKKEINKEISLLTKEYKKEIETLKKSRLSSREKAAYKAKMISLRNTINEKKRFIKELDNTVKEIEETRIELLAGAKEPNEKEKGLLKKIMDEIGDRIDEQLKMISDENARYLRKPVEAIALQVFDGDSIEIQLPNGLRDTVRLSDADTTDIGTKQPAIGYFSRITPEQNKQLYQEATEFTAEFLRKNQGKLRFQLGDRKVRDTYKRPLVKVTTTDGLDLSEELVKRGLAEPFYIGKSKDKNSIDKMKKLYRQARKNKLGVFRYTEKNNEHH